MTNTEERAEDTCPLVCQCRLKHWRLLTKLRTDPARATRLLRALLVLTNLEANR
nr:hypothetical protein StreXyl84_64850 [Streptomyces sp. Xyl84]